MTEENLLSTPNNIPPLHKLPPNQKMTEISNIIVNVFQKQANYLL